MKVHILVDEEGVHLKARAVSEDGKIRGTTYCDLAPGEDYHGYSYEYLRQLGNGPHELTFPVPPATLPKPRRAGA